MRDMVQLNAVIPRSLRRRAFVAFAEQEMRYAPWLRAQLEAWLEETEQVDEGIARPEGNGEERDEGASPALASAG